VGFASLEYLQSHELTANRQTRLLVIPHPGSKAELDSWLENSIASTQTNVYTYNTRHQDYLEAIQGMLTLVAGVEFLIAIVAAVALAVLNYIFFAQRRDEFGILHALGRSHPWLVLRTVKETGSAVGFAWLIGVAICILGLVSAQNAIYAPIGLKLDFSNLTPWLFTLPIPLAVVIAGAGTIALTLSRLDPVSIIERR
jgi:predicted lysophospholipase L1 biosynthesis ABC-type transport system permease subunit